MKSTVHKIASQFALSSHLYCFFFYLDDVPGLLDFLDICKKWLQNPKPELRPTLSSILTHPFYSHDFLTIHNFLQELPIKEENEKQEFFRLVMSYDFVKLNLRIISQYSNSLSRFMKPLFWYKSYFLNKYRCKIWLLHHCSCC